VEKLLVLSCRDMYIPLYVCLEALRRFRDSVKRRRGMCHLYRTLVRIAASVLYSTARECGFLVDPRVVEEEMGVKLPLQPVTARRDYEPSSTRCSLERPLPRRDR
jgi:hypothetical protein